MKPISAEDLGLAIVYDVDLIAKNTQVKDQKDHPQLGHCYRVVIQEDSKEKIDQVVRSQTMTKKRAPESGSGDNM